MVVRCFARATARHPRRSAFTVFLMPCAQWRSHGRFLGGRRSGFEVRTPYLSPVQSRDTATERVLQLTRNAVKFIDFNVKLKEILGQCPQAGPFWVRGLGPLPDHTLSLYSKVLVSETMVWPVPAVRVVLLPHSGLIMSRRPYIHVRTCSEMLCERRTAQLFVATLKPCVYATLVRQHIH